VNRRKNAAIPQGMVMMADGSLVSVNQAMGDMKVRVVVYSACIHACVVCGVCGMCVVVVDCGGTRCAGMPPLGMRLMYTKSEKHHTAALPCLTPALVVPNLYTCL
jgi:hypothetical protein